MADLPVIPDDQVSRAEVINNLLNLNLDRSLIAQVLRVDISEVRRRGAFTPVQDHELAQGVATLFNKALVRASWDLDYAHPDHQASLLRTLLGQVTKRYSGNSHDEASETRVTLERLLLNETAHAVGPGPEARTVDDQGQGRDIWEAEPPGDQ